MVRVAWVVGGRALGLGREGGPGTRRVIVALLARDRAPRRGMREICIFLVWESEVVMAAFGAGVVMMLGS